MTFEEFPIYEAIYEVRRQLLAEGQSVSTDDWVVKADQRLELTHRINEQLRANVEQKLIDAWIIYRKKGAVNKGTINERNKFDLLVEVAKKHGTKCFYGGRGKGECSEDVHLDRIVPESRGGMYTIENCIIACGRHNTMRSDKPIEIFLTETI